MNATLARTVRLVSEGCCWACEGPLVIGGGWAECEPCGRAYKLTAGRLIERTRMPEIAGRRIHDSCFADGIDMVTVLHELRPLIGDADGYVDIPADLAWIQWEIPL